MAAGETGRGRGKRVGPRAVALPQMALRCLDCGSVLLPGSPTDVITCGCPNKARVAGGDSEHLSWNALDRRRCEVFLYTGESE